jgi:hypothetical protein
MQNQFTDNTLITSISGNSTSSTDSTLSSNVAILHSSSNYSDCISEEVRNSFGGQIKTSSDPIPYRISARIHFPVEFQAMFNIFLFISPVGSSMEVTNDIRGTCTTSNRIILLLNTLEFKRRHMRPEFYANMFRVIRGDVNSGIAAKLPTESYQLDTCTILLVSG